MIIKWWATQFKTVFLCTVMYIYNCIYILVSLTLVCVVYVVKEVESFRGAWSINGPGT